MTFPYRSDIRLALQAIRTTKGRSFLTVLGIVIGVVSVISVVAIAQGVKKQVSGQINQLGKDLITVRPGQLVNRNSSGGVSGINIFSSFVNVTTLSQQDVAGLKSIPSVKNVVPLTALSSPIKVNDQAPTSTLIIGSTNELPDTLHQGIAYGGFFNSDNDAENVAVIGQSLTQRLFGENVPLGRSFQFQDQKFIVVGIFNNFETAPLSLNADFNNTIFIPAKVAARITNNNAPIYQILVKPKNSNTLNQTYAAVRDSMFRTHNGQTDFTVLRQNESLAVTNNILNILTQLISGIAAISLLVGGVGIMNVMLVTVTERTREIGIRKAIGATSRQILNQFMIEAIVLSLGGGVLGIILAFFTDYMLRIFTSLQPIISWQIVLLASAVAFLVGVIFGALPAFQAARKDPIESLRYE